MQFTAEQASEVKDWMVKKLEDISDADPQILCDYVWAILQADSTDKEIRQSAIENLEDFLKEHTVKFVDEIFARYAPQCLPTTTKPTTKFATATASQRPETAFPIQSYDSTVFGSQKPSEKFNTSRKRSYHDANSQASDLPYGNGVATRYPRSKKPPKDTWMPGQRVSSQQLPPPPILPPFPFMNAPLPPTPPPGFPPFDPNNPMAAFAMMQAMFPPMTGMLPPSPNGERWDPGEKRRCRDYDTKGYCILGSSCPYDHGNDLIVATKEDEYDPTRVNFSMRTIKSESPGSAGRAPRARNGGGGIGHPVPKRPNRAAFSDPRLPHKDCTTIVVEQIPEDYFEEETVESFFSQFGKVVEITMKPYKHLALVKYETHGSAKRAWESPKAIFDNRFVKVYWYRPDLNSENDTTRTCKETNGRTEVDSMDGKAFKEQQQEKQKAYEERLKTRKAMADAREDLVRRRESVRKEREALVQKLALAAGEEGELHSLNGMQDSSDADPPDPKIKALRDQLAQMQAEAKSLGIDPDAAPRFAPPQQQQHRGGFAARAAYRGLGSSRSHHHHQRGPGHGFVRGRDPSVRKLDNRPRNLAISGVRFDREREENLRSYLTLMGPFEDIELNPLREDSRIVAFGERWMAEQVMHGRMDIPGVGVVEMGWVGGSGGGNGSGMSGPGTGVGVGVSMDMDTGEDGGGLDAGRGLGGEEEARGQMDDGGGGGNDDQDLDVAGGDEDDWGSIT